MEMYLLNLFLLCYIEKAGEIVYNVTQWSLVRH